MTETVSGTVAIVTGAGSGIGQATARRFASEGASVLAADQDADGLAQTLSGLDTSRVVTRVVVGLGTRRDHVETTTHITFAPLTFAQIQRYCASGEPMGKAGAYAIQGQAAGFVLSLSGSLTGVIGLPVAETLELLSRFDVRPGGA